MTELLRSKYADDGDDDADDDADDDGDENDQAIENKVCPSSCSPCMHGDVLIKISLTQ